MLQNTIPVYSFSAPRSIIRVTPKARSARHSFKQGKNFVRHLWNCTRRYPLPAWGFSLANAAKRSGQSATPFQLGSLVLADAKLFIDDGASQHSNRDTYAGGEFQFNARFRDLAVRDWDWEFDAEVSNERDFKANLVVPHDD